MRTALVCLLAGFLWNVPQAGRADPFDYYFNTDLRTVPDAKEARKVDRLTVDLLTEYAGALKGTTGAFVVVKTNDGRWAKLLAFSARQKVGDDKSVPIFLIEKFVTYRPGEERTILVKGDNIRLFGDFQFNLDMGQVVPGSVGGDLRFVVDKEDSYVEPVGKAEIYLLTKSLASAKPDLAAKRQVGEKFEPAYFTGVYKIFEDGRRTGTLTLRVEEGGKVVGYYFSDKDGNKYEVEGKVGNPSHVIDFRIMFPRTMQMFHGLMFTGNGQAIAGSAVMEQRETGFYAVRLDEEKK